MKIKHLKLYLDRIKLRIIELTNNITIIYIIHREANNYLNIHTILKLHQNMHKLNRIYLYMYLHNIHYSNNK